jgi:fructokinase
MKRPLIVGIGEVLWDMFPGESLFGGAPANFAAHSAAFEPDVRMISAVGDDALGRQALQELQDRGIPSANVAVSGYPTGTVTVTLDDAGKADYVFANDTAWDNLEWDDSLAKLAVQTDVVCFGTLGQRSEISRSTIVRFVRSTPADALRIFDVNLRQSFYSDDVIRASLEMANVLKLNDDELDTLVPDDGREVRDRLQRLLTDYELRLVVYTRGDKGALLVADGKSVDYVGIPVPVKDTVGAGDAFTAVVAIGLLRGRQLHDIAARASKVAGYVCMHSGATPPLPEPLRIF